MARPLRIQAPDVVFHVTSRGVEKRAIFDVARHDREYFLSLFDKVVRRTEWRCLAYCLMGNHFHLAVETPKANLAEGMQLLKGDYAQWFNAVNGREGTLFERRYWSDVVAGERRAFALARYIALNPVRAGLVRHPEEWPWSSYSATVGLAQAPPFLQVDGLLDWFGGGRRGRVSFAQFVGEELPASRRLSAERDMAGV